MLTARMAEILHTKDTVRFAALIARLIQAGLLNPRDTAGGAPEPPAGFVLVNGRRYETEKKAA